MIENTLFYPLAVFDTVAFTDAEIKETKSLFRKLFNYEKLKFKEIDFENKNYGQLLKLIAYGSRNERTKKWIDFLINEFTRIFHLKYKTSYNLIFTNLTTPIAYLDQESMKRVIAFLKYEKRKYDKLEEEKRTYVDYSCLLLQEIFSLKESINLIMSKFTEIFDINAVASKDIFLNILNVYNYLDKISAIFETFFDVKIINAYLRDFEYLRHSIAHSHLIISVRQIDKGKTFSIQEYLKVDYKSQTWERFTERPSTLFLEMILIATIFTQILVLYQLLLQDKQQKNEKNELKPGSIVNIQNDSHNIS